MGLSDSRPGHRLARRRGSRPLARPGLPRFAEGLPRVPFPLPRWTATGAFVGCFPGALRPSPLLRRVGVHDFTFEACSGFHSRYGPRSCWPTQGGRCPRGFGRGSCPRPPLGWLPSRTDPYSGGSFIRWSSALSWRTEKSGLGPIYGGRQPPMRSVPSDRNPQLPTRGVRARTR